MNKGAEENLYMSRCLHLAALGDGYVAPNPLVGAVLVYENEIIGEGYHQKYGEAHAEPNAINSVKQKDLLPKSTLYVNLEPCSHHGKTPPCAELIIKSGIKKVVIGTEDPNPKVSGKGIRMLKNAGIKIKIGVLKDECNELNKRFFTFQKQKRPYVILKWAQTKDGFIDKIRTNFSEPPLIISNKITSQLTHKMRAENQSILIGTNTALLDNPRLTVRNWTGKNPIRIVLDADKRIPHDYHIFDGEVPTLIFVNKLRISKPNVKNFNLKYVHVDFSKNRIQHILNAIYKENIHSVLVEGGAALLTNFIETGCWDEANVEISPVQIGSGTPAPFINNIFPESQTEYNEHLVLHYMNKFAVKE